MVLKGSVYERFIVLTISLTYFICILISSICLIYGLHAVFKKGDFSMIDQHLSHVHCVYSWNALHIQG